MIRKIIKYGVFTVLVAGLVGYLGYRNYLYHEVIKLALSEPLKMDCDNGAAVGIGRMSGAKHAIVSDDEKQSATCYIEDDKGDSSAPPVHHLPNGAVDL